jgi:diguanylate cyclase (GGDEF)-like protein/PAS domain S-box-containing protein
MPMLQGFVYDNLLLGLAILVPCLAGLSIYQQRRLRATDQQFRAAVANMSQGLLMFDANAILVVCNEPYLQMYGLSPKVVKPGCSLRQLLEHRVTVGSFALSDPDQYVRDLRAAIAQGKTINKTVELTDGRIIAVSSRPVKGGGWVATHEDVTVRCKAERELDRTRKFLDAMIENIPVTILVKHANDLRFAFINRAGEQLFGVSREKVIGKTARDLNTEAEAQYAESLDAEALRSGRQILVGDNVIHTPHNGVRTVSVKKLAISSASGQPEYVLSVLEDVTERKRAEDELRRTQAFLDTVVDNVPVTILVKGASDFRYILVNRAAEDFYGMPREQIVGKTPAEAFPKASAERIAMHDKQLLASGSQLSFEEHLLETPHKGTRLVTSKRAVIRDAAGQPQYLLGVHDDVTERRQAESKIAHMASHDTLTDLPNRAAFNHYLQFTVERKIAGGEGFAVLSIDLDRFKEINDVFGHSVGDALLCEVSRRLQSAAGDAFLARLGGDEFMMIASDGPHPAQAGALADRLLATIADELEIEGHRLRTGVSIGIAVFPTDGADITALLANADAALYRAKEEGRGTIRFFEADMDRQLRDRRALRQDLQTAIANNELAVHYQPQAKIGGEIIGFEALVRWHHPARGLIPPATFIPLAEESGVIIPLGEWILRQACREAASWSRPLNIAINLSPAQFRHGDLARMTHGILLETGLAANRLELEITEGVLIDDFSRAVAILRQLKALGVRIAMDDFGTGYSSLSYLQSFPFDKIKIDRSFISKVERNAQSAAIVRAVISLARGLQLPVVAEGVETNEELTFLSDESCDEIQGYFIGRPRPIEDYAELVGGPTQQAARTG